MIDDHNHEDDVDDDEGDSDDTLQLELSTQSQIFLDMRQQNLDLLEIATRVAGYSGEQGPLKQSDTRQVLKSIWELYSEFYTWIDPEEAADEDEEDMDE